MISEREFDAGIARRLKLLRLGYDLSQEEFGSLIGVGGTAISNYEATGRGFSAYYMIRLRDALNAPIEWLIAGDVTRITDDLRQRLAKAETKLREDPSAKRSRQIVKKPAASRAG